MGSDRMSKSLVRPDNDLQSLFSQSVVCGKFEILRFMKRKRNLQRKSQRSAIEEVRYGKRKRDEN